MMKEIELLYDLFLKTYNEKNQIKSDSNQMKKEVV